jgi:hypothetical protein
MEIAFRCQWAGELISLKYVYVVIQRVYKQIHCLIVLSQVRQERRDYCEKIAICPGGRRGKALA